MSMANNASNGQKPPVDNGENKKMEIEITRFKGIVNAFNTPTALAKLIIVISLIIVLVFFGISVIALVVKSYYPYKAVNSNEYGATIIENEDNEVIYWLFNTADLWANSGIRVKEGDVISVRASGAFNSSIHHLVEEASENKKGRNWLSPMGGSNSSGPREEHRASYRISQTHPFNTLLMQVIPEDVELRDNDGNWTTEYDCYLDGIPKVVRNNNNTIDHNRSIYPDIYAIGAERDKITIRSDGVLYFAVNDIALTKNVIMQMKEKVRIKQKANEECEDTSKLEIGKFPIPAKDTAKIKKFIKDLDKGFKYLEYKESGVITYKFSDDGADNAKYNFDCATYKYRKLYEDFHRKINSLWNVVNAHNNKEYTLSKKDSLIFREHFTELDYYLIRNFVDAWFVDNAGSYLIVIERKKQ